MLGFTRLSHYAAMIFFAASAILYCAAILSSSKRLEQLGRGLALAGFGSLALQLGVRWTAVGYLPVTGLFSTLAFLTLWMSGISVYFNHRYKAKGFMVGAMALCAVALAGGSTGSMELKPLIPALDTPLFFLHVASSFAAYGLFALGGLLGVYILIGVRGSETGMDNRMLDESLYIGYILFTWCMIAGSLWAYLAWGSYWTWKIKGLWSTILWFYYSGVIHVRNRSAWQGRPIGILAIVGLGLVIFTFLGLGLLFETSHPLT